MQEEEHGDRLRDRDRETSTVHAERGCTGERWSEQGTQ